MSTHASSDQHGFTLLEVLIALTIAGAGLVAAFKTAGVAIDGVQQAGQTVAALRHAEGHLAEIGITVPLKPGEIGGVEDDGYHWRVRTTLVASHSATEANAPARLLYSVESVVTWNAGGRERSVRLDSARTGVAPAQGETR